MLQIQRGTKSAGITPAEVEALCRSVGLTSFINKSSMESLCRRAAVKPGASVVALDLNDDSHPTRLSPASSVKYQRFAHAVLNWFGIEQIPPELVGHRGHLPLDSVRDPQPPPRKKLGPWGFGGSKGCIEIQRRFLLEKNLNTTVKPTAFHQGELLNTGRFQGFQEFRVFNEALRSYDHDNTGRIPTKAFKAMVAAYRFDRGCADRLILQYDTRGDGDIPYVEFLHRMVATDFKGKTGLPAILGPNDRGKPRPYKSTRISVRTGRGMLSTGTQSAEALGAATDDPATTGLQISARATGRDTGRSQRVMTASARRRGIEDELHKLEQEITLEERREFLRQGRTSHISLSDSATGEVSWL